MQNMGVNVVLMIIYKKKMNFNKHNDFKWSTVPQKIRLKLYILVINQRIDYFISCQYSFSKSMSPISVSESSSYHSGSLTTDDPANYVN